MSPTSRTVAKTFSVSLHLESTSKTQSMTSIQLSKQAIFSSDITFHSFSLLLPLELHFLHSFSTVILYDYGWNRLLLHTLRRVPIQKQPTLQLRPYCDVRRLMNNSKCLTIKYYFFFGKIHSFVAYHTKNWYTYYCQTQQILLVPSIHATHFGRTDKPQALNTWYFKLKIKCIYI